MRGGEQRRERLLVRRGALPRPRTWLRLGAFRPSRPFCWLHLGAFLGAFHPSRPFSWLHLGAFLGAFRPSRPFSWLHLGAFLGAFRPSHAESPWRVVRQSPPPPLLLPLPVALPYSLVISCQPEAARDWPQAITGRSGGGGGGWSDAPLCASVYVRRCTRRCRSTSTTPTRAAGGPAHFPLPYASPTVPTRGRGAALMQWLQRRVSRARVDTGPLFTEKVD